MTVAGNAHGSAALSALSSGQLILFMPRS